MPITDYLERNAREYGNDVALVEINPDVQETRRVTWREYELIESNPTCQYRREMERVQREGKQICQSSGVTWNPEGRQGRYPHDELP